MKFNGSVDHFFSDSPPFLLLLANCFGFVVLLTNPEHFCCNVMMISVLSFTVALHQNLRTPTLVCCHGASACSWLGCLPTKFSTWDWFKLMLWHLYQIGQMCLFTLKCRFTTVVVRGSYGTFLAKSGFMVEWTCWSLSCLHRAGSSQVLVRRIGFVEFS